MLEARDLSASYGKHRALEGASLRVDRGEIVVILGANGAGKSTLLKAISGICEGRVSGSVTMNGHQLVGEKPDRIVEEGIALVPEGRGIFGELTVEENLLLGAYAHRARDEEDGNLERVYRLFPKLKERRRQVARTMSGGEQQMVAIGRAMMSNPAVLTLDEPSLGLSPLLSKELFHSLKAVRQTGIGILLVEQNAKASLAIADRGYLLENTHIIKEDSARNLAGDPAVQKAYLGGAAAGAGPRAGRSGASAKPAPAPFVPSEPRPYAGPSPADIAASALQSLAAPARPAPAKPAAPVQAAPAPAPKSAPQPAPAPTRQLAPSAAAVHGIDVESLVARARDVSSSRSEAQNGKAPAPMPASTPTKRPTLPMPDLNSHGDRLRAVLGEIEAAAVRARQRSQTRSGRDGRDRT
jgi:branched-chain amino acid transport system ATP-binding protein